MKATGVVRRIDDLGRIVLPKELRRTMRIKEGESLEIYTDGDNKIVLKKYSPVNQINDFVKEFTESMYTTNKRNILVTDNEKIVAASGDFDVELTGKKITKELEERLKNRNTQINNSGINLNVCDVRVVNSVENCVDYKYVNAGSYTARAYESIVNRQLLHYLNMNYKD